MSNGSINPGNALLTLLILLGGISLKIAFVNNAGWVAIILALIVVALLIYLNYNHSR